LSECTIHVPWFTVQNLAGDVPKRKNKAASGNFGNHWLFDHLLIICSEQISGVSILVEDHRELLGGLESGEDHNQGFVSEEAIYHKLQLIAYPIAYEFVDGVQELGFEGPKADLCLNSEASVEEHTHGQQVEEWCINL
jgi:hypothetical protein